MGANVSLESCKADYKIDLNCTALPGKSWGGLVKGDIQPDPDIAGIGIISVFIAVTCTALLAGFIDVIWQIAKILIKNQHRVPTSPDRPSSPSSSTPRRSGPSASDILETIVICCADQQLFTGGAYAIAVRYFKGCSVSAYHYNILVNGLLISCATHLVAVAIATRYWKYFFMGLLRATLTGLVFLVTGLLLTKANEGAGRAEFGAFPVGVPEVSRASYNNGSTHFLPAACFMQTLGPNQLAAEVSKGFGNPNRVVLGPNQAWSLYLLMLLWWSVAVVGEGVKFLGRGLKKEKGVRKAMLSRVGSWTTGGRTPREGEVEREGPVKKFFRRFGHFLHMAYLVCGLTIGTFVVGVATNYIVQLRDWVDKSEWMTPEGENPEDDAKSFGQLVPIFMSSLTVFAFLQMVSEKFGDSRRRARAHADEEAARKEKGDITMLAYTDSPRGRSPSPGAVGSSKRSKSAPFRVEETPIMPTPGSEYTSWMPSPGPPSSALLGSQPLLGGSDGSPDAKLTPAPLQSMPKKMTSTKSGESVGYFPSSKQAGAPGFHAR